MAPSWGVDTVPGFSQSALQCGWDMLEQTATVATLDELRQFIHTKLCEKENLLAEQFRLREAALMMRGRQCGMEFTVKGPRSIRLGAIWASDQSIVNFYDTQGERYLKVKLARPIALPQLAASA